MNDKKLKNTQNIIVNGIELLKESGYNGVSVQDIVQKVGIPKGSFYNYFESKDDFLKKTMDYYFHQESKVYFDILKNEELAPKERVKEFFRVQITDIKNDPCIRGCLLGNIIQELGGSDEEIDIVLKNIFGMVIYLVSSCLEDEKNTAYNLSATECASFIINSWQGTLLNYKINKDTTTFKTFQTILDSILS